MGENLTHCVVAVGTGKALSAAADYDDMLERFAQLVVDGGFADECLIETYVSPLRDDDEPTKSPTSGARGRVRSAMHVALVVRGTLVGAMSLNRFARSRAFAEADRELADALGWCAALMIENASLVDAARTARESAERAMRAKDEFLSLASHELRTPLTAVLGWARMLLTGNLDARYEHRAVEAIERNARAEVRLVEDLLEVGALLGGDRRLHRKPMLPVDVVARVFDSVSDDACAREIRLRLVIELDPGAVVGDAEQLQRIVTGLLENAIKVSPRGGQVTVRMGRTGDDLEISVEDGGAGVEPNLGLALAARLVELQHGTMRATSEGHGTQVVVRIPVPRESDLPGPPPSSRQDPHKVSGDVLRSVRLERGWTRERLAAEAGLSPEGIALIESNALAVSLAIARRISAVLRVTIDELRPRDPDERTALQSGVHCRLNPANDDATSPARASR